MRRLALCAVATCLAAVVTAVAIAGPGNGMAQKSPDEIVAAAIAAGSSARSVHVHGGGTSGGTPLILDLRIGKAEGKGRLTANGLSFDIIRLGPDAYFRGDATFWKKAGGAKFAPFASLFSGKWIKASATSGDLASFAPLTDVGTLVSGILGNHGKIVSKGTTKFNGQWAVVLKDSDGSYLYVATTGQPYPLGISQGGKQHGTLMFDNWGQPLTVAAPAHSLDLTTFLKH